jgi:precorrin-2 dehydrogenase/sirohydrochlorin ferrochelatase
MYPVMLSLENNPCLVVGGGRVALRKVKGLLSEGAMVTVVAPAAEEELEAMAEMEAIRLERRPYRTGETAGYFLIMAATNDNRVNRQVFLDAKDCGIWVNVADDPKLCTFYLPARMKRGPMQLVIASTGLAPFAMRRLRKLFEKRFGPEWENWIQAAARFRKAVYKNCPDKQKQGELFDIFFDATVDEQDITARVPTEEEETAWLGQLKNKD